MPRVAQQIANLQRANRNRRVLKPKKPKKPTGKKPAQGGGKKPAGTKTGKYRIKK